jgi:hypothetical protein
VIGLHAVCQRRAGAGSCNVSQVDAGFFPLRRMSWQSPAIGGMASIMSAPGRRLSTRCASRQPSFFLPQQPAPRHRVSVSPSVKDVSRSSVRSRRNYSGWAEIPRPPNPPNCRDLAGLWVATAGSDGSRGPIPTRTAPQNGRKEPFLHAPFLRGMIGGSPVCTGLTAGGSGPPTNEGGKGKGE